MKIGKRLLATSLILIFLLSIMPAVSATGVSSTAEATGDGIKIMTYNVMDDVAPNEDGSFSYDSPANREDAIAVMLKEYLPDVIGMQEDLFGRREDLMMSWAERLGNGSSKRVC